MARVVMIPTGLAEWHGLPGAFRRLFPEHTFEVLPSDEELVADPDSYPLDGFTSCALSEASEREPPESAQELVSRAAGAAVGDERARVEGADLVVILDDLEPANVGQPDRVVRVIRAAVAAHLASVLLPHRDKTRDVLRAKVSFHLAAPMIEGWFFGDPDGLERATRGVRCATNANRFAATADPEGFVVDDPDYASATESACPTWVRKGRKRRQCPRWLSPAIDRMRHPKAYLQWLCLDGNASHGTKYKESDHGAAALRDIDWAALLGREDPAHLQFLSALVSDVADAVGVHPQTGPLTRATSPWTTSRTSDPARVLRNL